MTFILKELKINGVADLLPVHLQFNEQYPVCVMQCPTRKCPTNIRHVVSTALQLICGGGVATTEAEVKSFQNACIHLVFSTTDMRDEIAEIDDNVPSTSKAITATELSLTYGYRKIAVERDFNLNGGECVTYTVNDDCLVQRCAWSDFHQKYFTDVDGVLPHLRELQPNPVTTANQTPWQRGNWLQLLATKSTDTNGKELFQQVFELAQQEHEFTDLLSQLTTSCLLVLNGLNIIKTTQICKILQDVRKIFEYITCYEYTVWFLIPIHGQIKDVMNCTESFDFHNVKTRIQLLTAPLTMKTYSWTNVEHVLQDLLLVAFQMAFAFHCKQKIVYLQQLDRIASRQSFHMALNAGNNRNPSKYNYLQRIIDVCNKICITAIIEYSAGLYDKPINANLIKSHKIFGSHYQLFVDAKVVITSTPVNVRGNHDFKAAFPSI